MHVGLNLIFLVPGETGGMESYARELAPRLARINGLHVTAFVNRTAAGEDFGCEQVVVPVDARNRAAWVGGEQVLLPSLARAQGCDLVHSLASTAPIRGRFRRVVTVHDLMYANVPEAHFGIRGKVMRVLVPTAVRSSHRVIAISDTTKRDLVTHLHTAPLKIDVVPQAAAPPRPEIAPPEADLRSRFSLGSRPILLSPSAKRPHKNLLRLLEAFARLREPRPVLVLPGYATPHEAELRACSSALGLEDDVRFLGWVSAGELEGLYALADACVVPSLYEGFGLPVIEAMARGVPVACSSRGALAEVAGGAALTFEPTSVSAIADALSAVLDRGDRLKSPGLARAAQFSWAATAAGTHTSYVAAVKSPAAAPDPITGAGGAQQDTSHARLAPSDTDAYR